MLNLLLTSESETFLQMDSIIFSWHEIRSTYSVYRNALHTHTHTPFPQQNVQLPTKICNNILKRSLQQLLESEKRPLNKLQITLGVGIHVLMGASSKSQACVCVYGYDWGCNTMLISFDANNANFRRSMHINLWTRTIRYYPASNLLAEASEVDWISNAKYCCCIDI